MKQTVLFSIFTCWLAILPLFSVRSQDKSLQLATLFDTLHSRGNFNGSVLVAEKGKILFQKVYGVADAETGRPLTARSVFELASVSKPFTALAIVQLKEKGLLSYDDPLRKFFPELPYEGVLVRHLLTHSSGIPDMLGWDEAVLGVDKINTNADILKILPAKIPSLSPQPDYQYANTNYILLAAIVEKVAGVPFPDYLKQHIFLPAGMKNTRLASRYDPALPADRALDYAWDGGQNRFVRADSLKRYLHFLARLQGAYGIWSTAEDLYKWVRALDENKLIGAAARNEAFSAQISTRNGTPIISFPEAMNVAFGWQLIPGKKDVPDRYASGSYGGYTSLIVKLVSADQTVIMLSNFIEMAPVITFMDHIAEILEGGGLRLPEKITLQKGVSLPPAKWPGYDGTYTSPTDPTFTLMIKVRNNRAYLRFGDDAMELNIFPENEEVFFLINNPNKVKFSRDPTGNITGLTLLSPRMHDSGEQKMKEEFLEKAK